MRRLLAIVTFSFALTSFAAADDEHKPVRAWLDPATAAAEDRDFTVQGEYGAKRQKYGVQVVALGNGKFDAYLLEGGLPGMKKKVKKPTTVDKLSGEWQGEGKNAPVEFANEKGDLKATIKDGKIMVTKDDKSLAALPRIERKSETLDAKPPAGAIVLFDGTSAEKWNDARVEKGMLTGNNSTSKQKFGDYTLHAEYRTPYMPEARGQHRGNSGIYHQGRYETQILDSFGLEGKMDEAGGIYSIADPMLNMCFPPLTWQTYDVEFTDAKFDKDGKRIKPAKMTVKLNGVVVQKNVELPDVTTSAPVEKITPEPGPIFLQNHGDPVYFRNIWIVTPQKS